MINPVNRHYIWDGEASSFARVTWNGHCRCCWSLLALYQSDQQRQRHRLAGSDYQPRRLRRHFFGSMPWPRYPILHFCCRIQGRLRSRLNGHWWVHDCCRLNTRMKTDISFLCNSDRPCSHNYPAVFKAAARNTRQCLTLQCLTLQPQ